MLHLLSFLFTLIVLPAASQLICDYEIMGKPQVADCNKAYDRMPFALAPSGGVPDLDRLFAEPQYLRDPFSPVFNPFSSKFPIVQLPKIWRYGTFTRSWARKFPQSVGSIDCRDYRFVVLMKG